MVPLFSRRRGTPLHYSLKLIRANYNRCTVMRCNSKINCSKQFFRHVIILAPIVYIYKSGLSSGPAILGEHNIGFTGGPCLLVYRWSTHKFRACFKVVSSEFVLRFCFIAFGYVLVWWRPGQVAKLTGWSTFALKPLLYTFEILKKNRCSAKIRYDLDSWVNHLETSSWANWRSTIIVVLVLCSLKPVSA